jgi:hypothetical protein
MSCRIGGVLAAPNRPAMACAQLYYMLLVRAGYIGIDAPLIVGAALQRLVMLWLLVHMNAAYYCNL